MGSDFKTLDVGVVFSKWGALVLPAMASPPIQIRQSKLPLHHA